MPGAYVRHGARYGGYTARPRVYKPPSAYRRDALRKQQFIEKKTVVAASERANASTQCDLDNNPIVNNEKVNTNFRITRSKAKELSPIEQPIDTSSESDINMSIASVLDSANNVSVSEPDDDESESILITPAKDGYEACDATDQTMKRQTADGATSKKDESDQIDTNQFTEYMTCHYNDLEGRHFSHWQDMLICTKCKIIVCKLCKFLGKIPKEHTGHLNYICLIWKDHPD